MNGETIGAIVVACISTLTGVVSAVLSYNARKRTDRLAGAAAAFEAYDELAANYRTELGRIQDRLRQAEEDVQSAEERCRACNKEVAGLMSVISTLRAVVLDEVARTAADAVMTARPALDEDAEVEDVRRFLREARREE